LIVYWLQVVVGVEESPPAVVVAAEEEELVDTYLQLLI
jgi:hypothetical protein